jgi:hypothetical protein
LKHPHNFTHPYVNWYNLFSEPSKQQTNFWFLLWDPLWGESQLTCFHSPLIWVILGFRHSFDLVTEQ